jgi:hypothetical protein
LQERRATLCGLNAPLRVDPIELAATAALNTTTNKSEKKRGYDHRGGGGKGIGSASSLERSLFAAAPNRTQSNLPPIFVPFSELAP